MKRNPFPVNISFNFFCCFEQREHKHIYSDAMGAAFLTEIDIRSYLLVPLMIRLGKANSLSLFLYLLVTIVGVN